MATKSQIRQAILAVAGNPESGPIAALAEEMAKAIVALDAPEEKAEKPSKETRVVTVAETR
jgi:hypothetical protein